MKKDAKMNAKVKRSILMQAIRPPAWAKDELMVVDVKNKSITIQIPPCIADSPFGAKLVGRIMSGSWSFYNASDIDASALEATSAHGMLKFERNLCLREEPVHSCATCGNRGLKKCSRCLLVYYCTTRCQKLDWKHHKKTCTPMESTLQEHFAIAVPDFKCFFHYQGALEKKRSDEGALGICILSLKKFTEMFGEDGVLGTCVNLALYGKPSMLIINVCCGEQSKPAASSSAEWARVRLNEDTQVRN